MREHMGAFSERRHVQKGPRPSDDDPVDEPALRRHPRGADGHNRLRNLIRQENGRKQKDILKLLM